MNTETSTTQQPPVPLPPSAPAPKADLLPEVPALKRIRFLSQLLDHSIPLPGGYRIGLDPIFGLIPGWGDFLGTVCSSYLVAEAYRLGIPKGMIGRMLLNIAAEALVGAIPVAGDIFDAIWKANMRNLRLVENSYHRDLKPRSIGKLVVGLGLGFVLFLIGIIALNLLLLRSVLSWIERLVT